MCVFPYASLISLYFHLDFYEALIAVSSPWCVSLRLPVSLSQSLLLCVSFFSSLPASLSTPPSSPSPSGSLGSSSLLPPPSALSDLLQPPARASLAAEAVTAGEAGTARAAGLDWGVESRLSRGQATVLGPRACWARRPAWSPGQGGQGEVPL